MRHPPVLMRGIGYACLRLCLTILSLSGWAQTAHDSNPAPFLIDHIGVNDGLTQGSVYYMHKDSRGFLWLGTQDGLNRYDGHRFRPYRPVVGEQGASQPGTIRGVNIFGIIEDPGGNLWVGTEVGLNRYDRQRDCFDYFPATGSDGRPLDSRTLPFAVNQTELLYLSDAEGLVRFNYRSRRKAVLAPGLHPTKEYDLPNSTVLTTAGDVWLHAPKGLMRYNLRSRTLTHYFSDRPDNQFGPVQTVFSFFVDTNNIIWLGTGGGLIRFDYQRRNYRTYTTVGTQPVSAIYSIAKGQGERLWLGTQRDGVLHFDKRSGKVSQLDALTNSTWRLNDYEVSKVYVDDLGVIWANADPDGLVRIVTNAFVFGGMTKRQTIDNLPPDRKLTNYTVRGFMEERPDRLWVVNEEGIDILNPQTNRIVQRYLTNARRSDSPIHNLARCIYRDPQRRIWVGTPGGVLLFEPERQTFDPILFTDSTSQVADNYVRNLVSINDTILIGATEDGLYELNTRQRRWSKVPVLPGQNTFSLWYDATNRQLWVGTYTNGYFCYQLPPAKLSSASFLSRKRIPGQSIIARILQPWRLIKSGLKGYTVLHIRPDTDQQSMWLSCDRGLVALKPNTGQFMLFNEQRGLSNSFVYGTLIDAQRNIWMSTNRGISRLNPATQTIKNFTLNDGLQGYEYNGNAFCQTKNGELYFGGVNGFNRFRPDRFRSSSFNPNVHIYSLNVNEVPYTGEVYVDEATHIDLSHNQNTLSLEFAAQDYFSNGYNTYQYQLTNYDDQWVSAGERNYVRYANLPPGDYTFQVKAANKDAHWSSHVHKLNIHIEPPFWQKGPFLVLAAFLVGVGIFAWIRQRETVIRQQEADRLRLAYDIQEQVKRQIARDLHDEIGTRLATVKLYTTQLTRQVGDTPTISSLKATIFGLINDTINDVRNLLRKLNPQTLEQHGYVAAVEELFSRINGSEVVSTHLLLSELPSANAPADDAAQNLATVRFPADTEVMLYRISQELVNNSLKHANAHRLELHIQQQPDRLVLTYTDDGQGFDYTLIQQKPTGLGLGSIESRVAILGGKINWQTQPGQGLRVVIDVPISNLPKRRHFNESSGSFLQN